MKSIFEGGEEEKKAEEDQAQPPQTDRPGAGEEQLAEKEEPPAPSLAKPQDESNVMGLDQSQSELPLRSAPDGKGDITKVKSKKASKPVKTSPETGGPMGVVDNIKDKADYVMKWRAYLLTGGGQPTAAVGVIEESEYRKPAWQKFLDFAKKWGYWILVIVIAVGILVQEFDKWGGLKSQSMQVFKRRIHFYDMDKQVGGIATLLPVHFFQRWVKLDVVEILECVEKQNERACYSVARRNCIAAHADPKGWNFLNCMFTALQKSTIKMDDYCRYHFDDDVEKTWDAADKTTIKFIDQRYACQQLASGKSPTYCVEKYERIQLDTVTWPDGWDMNDCKDCFKAESNDRWLASGCDAEEVCNGIKDGRDCDIWPKVEAATQQQASAGQAQAQAANQLEVIVGDGSSYRGKQTRTRGGKVCQAWNAQTPNSHYRTPKDYPDAGLESNYCRNPDGNTNIWCFTTDPKSLPNRQRWDFCDPINAKRSKEACDADSINKLFNPAAGDHQSNKAAGCWKEDAEDPTAGCDCDASCKACGYGDTPTQADQCISCTDGTYIFKKQTGKEFGECTKTDSAKKAAGCWAAADDTDPIDAAKCTCDASCSACGYSTKPVGADACLSCADGTHLLTTITGKDYGTCAAPARRRLEEDLDRTRDEARFTSPVKAPVAATNSGDKFDPNNRYRVRQNSAFTDCLNDAEVGDARYDNSKCTLKDESCGYYSYPAEIDGDPDEIKAVCILSAYCGLRASIWPKEPSREIPVAVDMVDYRCPAIKRIVAVSKAEQVDLFKDSLLQNDDYALDGYNLRGCYDNQQNYGVNVWQYITRQFCEFEFLYVSQELYYSQLENCYKGANLPYSFNYRSCMRLWKQNKKAMAYDKDPVYATQEGHCHTQEDAAPAADDTTVDAAATTAVACKDACTEDHNCGGYERDPTTKECKLFAIGNLKGDGTADYTCEVKQYQQMLSIIIKEKGDAIEALPEGEICAEESECEVDLRCPAKKATDSAMQATVDALDKKCVKEDKCDTTDKDADDNEFTYKCQKDGGTVKPNDACTANIECFFGFKCATATVVPADPVKQRMFDDIGKTCQYNLDCDKEVEIQNINVSLKCDEDSRRRRLETAKTPAAPARRFLAALADGCYKTAADTDPIAACECHETCRTCGYDDKPTLSTECLTCKDLDHVLRKEDGKEYGKCALPSTGTYELVQNPTDEIYEQYKVDCNKAYYRYVNYQDCDNTIAESFSPVHIFDAATETQLIELNEKYIEAALDVLRDKKVREDKDDFIEYAKLLGTRQEDLVDVVKNKRQPLPTQCQKSADWLAQADYGINVKLALKADSCFTLAYSGLLTHAQFTKCMKYSGDEDPFEQQAFALFYKPDFASVAEEDIKAEFEAFMEMPYTAQAKCFMQVLSTLQPRSIEDNFEQVSQSLSFEDCLASIDKEKSYNLLKEDIAPSLNQIEWYQRYDQLDSLIKFIDDRDMESYCSFKFKIFKDDYARRQYCEATMNVRPKAIEYCTLHPQYVDQIKFAYPLVYKYSCLVKNGLAFGTDLEADSVHFPELMNCFFENNLYKAQECLKYMEDLIAGSAGVLPTVELRHADSRSVSWKKLDIDAGTAVSCAQKALKAGSAICGTMKYINHSPNDGCFCYPDLGTINDAPGFNVYEIIDTGVAATVDDSDFVVLREVMDHYFYRMTSSVTEPEITSFMCAEGKRRTGMAFYTSPWANIRGVSMEPKWFLLSCSTFTAGKYIGGAVNSVDTITHYYFDQPDTIGRELADEDYLEEAEEIVPVALDYNPLPYIERSEWNEVPESDTRNYVLVNRTRTNQQRFRFQASRELTQLEIRGHEMYHDFGHQRWHLDTEEEYENFTKKANITLLWESNSQWLGHQVVGNDDDDGKGTLVGVPGASLMNIHVELLATKRIIGIPVEWRNQTQFQVVLDEAKRSAARGGGLQAVPHSDVAKDHESAFRQDTVLKINFTETVWTYIYYTFMDIIALLGGLSTSAGGIIASVAIIWAHQWSYNLSMMIKRKAQKNIQMIKIKRVLSKLPRIEAEINNRLADTRNVYQKDLEKDLSAVGTVPKMPEMYYEDIEEKARCLCRLEELYDVLDPKAQSPWEKHQCVEDDVKTKYYEERLSKYDYLGRLAFFKSRITLMSVFRMQDNIDMLNIKVKKMKHQLKDLYENKVTPLDGAELKKDTFTNNMFSPGDEDLKGEVNDLRRELNASLKEIKELKNDRLLQQEEMRQLKESVAALK